MAAINLVDAVIGIGIIALYILVPLGLAILTSELER